MMSDSRADNNQNIEKPAPPQPAKKTRGSRRRRSQPAEPSFYDTAVSEAERVLLPQARKVEGLDEEIALLRVKLATVLAEHPENTELVLKGVGMLTKAIATRYRLSHKAEQDLYQSVLGVLRGIGGAMFPEGFGDSDAQP